MPDFSIPLLAQHVFQTEFFNVRPHLPDKFLARFDNVIRTAEKIHVAVNDSLNADTVGRTFGRRAFNGFENVKIHIRILAAGTGNRIGKQAVMIQHLIHKRKSGGIFVQKNMEQNVVETVAVFGKCQIMPFYDFHFYQFDEEHMLNH